jgi:hypothetical protein
MNALRFLIGLTLLATVTFPANAADPPVTIHSPGFAPTVVDAQGRLLEDWGPVVVRLHGDGVTDGPIKVEAATLDGVIPAAKATADRGAFKVTATAYRAAAFPAGVDVLTVRVGEARGKVARVTLEMPLPEGAQVGASTVQFQGRTVLTLPSDRVTGRNLRAWGSCDEATSLPGWARPEGACDPAFRNIRAGMGGTPIVYRFPVAPKGSARVILGLCESHWTEPGQRPLTCQVEGAPAQDVDPIAKWGRHKPGALSFLGHDVNADGRLDVVVRTAPGASDRNPILNVIWVFPPGESPALEKVVTGDLNSAATHHVDVGGPGDQSIYPPGKVEYELALPAGASRELTFLVACTGGSSPVPDASTWTPASLRLATRQVWRDWKPAPPTRP